jgi:hypothetical protein
MYPWQAIDAIEYERQREELTRQQAELPPPKAPHVIAFDKAAVMPMSMADVVRDAPIEHQRRIVRHSG